MTDFSTVLTDIRKEIDRLVSEGIAQEEAVEQAVIGIIGKAAYEHTAAPHEYRLLEIISRIGKETGRPVATHRVCTETGSDYFITYYYLRNLERRGLLCRPSGPRSGWKVA
jgi:predicted metal-dependent phosphotriesterase family hydrolase